MTAKIANDERLRAAEKYLDTLGKMYEQHPSKIWHRIMQSETDLVKKVVEKLKKGDIKINFSDIQNTSINRILRDLKSLRSKVDKYVKKLEKNEKKDEKYKKILGSINNINDYSIKKVMSDISGLTVQELNLISLDKEKTNNLLNNIKIYESAVEDLISMNDHGAVYDFSRRANILLSLRRIESLDEAYASLNVKEREKFFDARAREFYELWLLLKNSRKMVKYVVAAIGIGGFIYTSNQEYQDKYGDKEHGSGKKEQKIDDSTKTTFNTGPDDFINKK